MTKLKTFYSIERKVKYHNSCLKRRIKGSKSLKNPLVKGLTIQPYKLTLVLKTSFSNVFFHLTNRKGKVVYSLWGGILNGKGKQVRRSRITSMALVDQLITYLQRTQTKKIGLVIMGFSPAQLPTLVFQMIKRLKKEKIDLVFLKDSSPVAHNGCRLAKHRRYLQF